MNIVWEIGDSDIRKIKDFIHEHKSPFIEQRIDRNIHRKDVKIDKDIILMTMLICLLTSEQEVSPDGDVNGLFRKNQELMTHQFLAKAVDVEYVISEVLKNNGLTGNVKKIPDYFSFNFSYLIKTKWDLEKKLINSLKHKLTKNAERELADSIDQVFKGFGSAQARSFLQKLGITKYEIPIDTQLINWMKNFGFPVVFSAPALQDRAFYHFISDGIQFLCEKADVYPCILDATIHSALRVKVDNEKM